MCVPHTNLSRPLHTLGHVVYAHALEVCLAGRPGSADTILHFALILIAHSTFSTQVILAEEDRVVVVRFGHDWDSTCMQMDETLCMCALIV